MTFIGDMRERRELNIEKYKSADTKYTNTETNPTVDNMFIRSLFSDLKNNFGNREETSVHSVSDSISLNRKTPEEQEWETSRDQNYDKEDEALSRELSGLQHINYGYDENVKYENANFGELYKGINEHENDDAVKEAYNISLWNKGETKDNRSEGFVAPDPVGGSRKISEQEALSGGIVGEDPMKTCFPANISSEIDSFLNSSESRFNPKMNASVGPAQAINNPETNYPQEQRTKERRKPEFHLPLDDLKPRNELLKRLDFISPAFSDTSAIDNRQDNLSILEPDFSVGLESEFHGFLDLTPSVQPPSSSGQGYFDMNNLESSASTTSKLTQIQSPSDNGLLGQSLFLPRDNGGNFNDMNSHMMMSTKSLDYFDENLTARSPVIPLGGDVRNEQIANKAPRPPAFLKGLSSGHLDVRRPGFERRRSSQSTSSIGSNSKKKRVPKGAICHICEKYISRDIIRHLRTHDEVGRFQCVFPRSTCSHKTGYFNRPYDYKKHLLHAHFNFDDPKARTFNNLTEKLPYYGSCNGCGQRFVACEWLDHHVLTNANDNKCFALKKSDAPN